MNELAYIMYGNDLRLHWNFSPTLPGFACVYMHTHLNKLSSGTPCCVEPSPISK